MLCRFCGEYVKDGASFCNHCGGDLRTASPDTGNVPQNGQSFPADIFPPPMQYPVRTYKKSNKGLIFLLVIIFGSIIVAVILPTIIGFNSDVRRVKNGHIDVPGYDDKTWGEVLDDICNDSKWERYKDDGDRMVKYTGTKKSNGNDMEIIFKIESDGKNFTIESITDGDMKVTNKMAISIAVLEMFDGKYK